MSGGGGLGAVGGVGWGGGGLWSEAGVPESTVGPWSDVRALSMGDGSPGAGQLREAVRRLRPDPGER